jgi:YrbI family 3-deoxy-D-manno-octulosonate 8-phosphate phosphatase
MEDAVSRAKKVRLFIMDVDGVLTDGGMIVGSQGEELKYFNTRDGLGIELLRQTEIVPVIITRERSPIIETRANKLMVKEVCIGVDDKGEAILALSKKYGVLLDEVSYIGDDLNDLTAFEKVGFRVAVRDASDKVKDAAHYITSRPGGHGAVREAIEFVLSSQGLLDEAIKSYVKFLKSKKRG